MRISHTEFQKKGLLCKFLPIIKNEAQFSIFLSCVRPKICSKNESKTELPLLVCTVTFFLLKA